MKKALTIGLVAILVLSVFVTGASAATILPGLKTSAPSEVDCVEDFTVISEGTAPIFEGTAPIFEGTAPIPEGITPITSTGWPRLKVSAPAVVDCDEAFTVTVTCNEHPIKGACVFLKKVLWEFQGRTDENGELICTIKCGRSFCLNKIKATKLGYISDSALIWLTKLEIEAPDSVTQGVDFTITVTAHGAPVEGARVWSPRITCNGHKTDENGKVNCSIIICDSPWCQWVCITARKSGYYCPARILIYSVPPDNPTPIPEDITSIPGGTTPIFEGITPIPEGMTPIPGGTTPIFEGITPIPEGITPIPEGITPIPEGITPTANT